MSEVCSEDVVGMLWSGFFNMIGKLEIDLECMVIGEVMREVEYVK